MYVPKEFTVSDLIEIENFITENSFGTIVVVSDNREPAATHIPFLINRIEDEFQLEGHISLANRQSEILKTGKTVLVIFQGPHAYISSSVYEHQNVPTWNYQSVHIYGTVEPMNDEELEEHLRKMVHLHEHRRENPLNYQALSSEILAQYRKEIIGFKVVSYKVEAAYKLSQNRNEADYQHIIDDLAKDKCNHAIVEQMKRIKK